MPTESTFLFAGLLFLAAALGYVFARFGDPDEEEEAQESARADFLKGFRYLLDEEPDRAVEVFTGVEAVTEEGLDTQIALGALFRRRGELDRAIRMHQNILDRKSLSSAQRERATFALAEDYLGAGLFDRAEDLYLKLRESPQHRADALRRLLRVCEVTRDWDRAVDISGDLRRMAPAAVQPAQLAHYNCELAEQAYANGDAVDARRLLEQAEAIEPGNARSALIRGDLARDAGDHRAAFQVYAALAARQPGMISELLPRLARSARAGGLDEALGDLIRHLRDSGPDGLRSMAMAVIRDTSIDEPAALDCLHAYLAQHSILHDLVQMDDLQGTLPAEQRRVLERIRAALHKLAEAASGYQCASCGYVSASLQWQCPGCRSWDTVRATDRLVLGGSVV